MMMTIKAPKYFCSPSTRCFVRCMCEYDEKGKEGGKVKGKENERAGEKGERWTRTMMTMMNKRPQQQIHSLLAVEK